MSYLSTTLLKKTINTRLFPLADVMSQFTRGTMQYKSWADQ